jgi:hypothetical protein
MKNLLFICLITPLISFGQYAKGHYANPNPQPIKIQVSKAPKTSADHYSDMQKNISQSFSNLSDNYAANARAAQIARANNTNAQSAALKDNYTKIDIDLLKGSSDKYKFLVIKRVSGWSTCANFLTIINEINGANKYSIVSLNTLGLKFGDGGEVTTKTSKNKKFVKQIDERQFYEPSCAENFLTNSETLFLYWSREAISKYDRLTRLILKNSDGETVYEAEYKNKGYSEMLKPLLSNYNFSRQDAKNKLIELKEYLDLGIITQDEFIKNAAFLKKILLGHVIPKEKKQPKELPITKPTKETDSSELLEKNYIITTSKGEVFKSKVYKVNKKKGVLDFQKLDGTFIRLKMNMINSIRQGEKEIFKN